MYVHPVKILKATRSLDFELGRVSILNERMLFRTLRAAAKLFFKLVAMLMSSGSLQVIMAMPAVKLRIMWWAATRM